MATPSSSRPGLVDSLRTLGDGLLASVQSRVGLFAVELQEEKFRLVQTCVWISAAVFAAMMTVMFACLTLVYLCWENSRLAALGGLTLLFAGGLLAIVAGFRRYLARQPAPFAATLEEIGEDRACIRPAT